MLPETLLVHLATPQRWPETQSSPAQWIEGEPGAETVTAAQSGPSFPCVLFLPSAGGVQSNPYRVRVVEQPTILFNPFQDDGTANVLGREDQVDVTAPELAPWLDGLETVRWLVNGQPQPFGPPGQVIGLQATLERVAD